MIAPHEPPVSVLTALLGVPIDAVAAEQALSWEMQPDHAAELSSKLR